MRLSDVRSSNIERINYLETYLEGYLKCTPYDVTVSFVDIRFHLFLVIVIASHDIARRSQTLSMVAQRSNTDLTVSKMQMDRLFAVFAGESVKYENV